MDSFNRASMDEDNILYQKYDSIYVRIFNMMLYFLYKIEKN